VVPTNPPLEDFTRELRALFSEREFDPCGECAM
jgi:hypothetical protein